MSSQSDTEQGLLNHGKRLLLPSTRTLLGLLLFLFTNPAQAGRTTILMIGDGMGPAQLEYIRQHEPAGGLARLPVIALLETASADSRVTDSAAAATALATGHVTRNGRLSLSAEGDTLATVLERAREGGMATGLVATAALTHATPAAFACHAESRYLEDDLAVQLIAARVDLLLGYGLGDFLPRSLEGSLREDELDLRPQLKAFYGSTAANERSFRGLRSLPALALLERGQPGRAPRPGPDLAELTAKALELLEADGRDFFLMIEGSQIDWAGHGRDASWLLAELRDFDRAVAVAHDYTLDHPDVLLLVTADHETGGLSLHENRTAPLAPALPVFSHDQHTAVSVPLLAAGEGNAWLSGLRHLKDLGAALEQRLQAGP